VTELTFVEQKPMEGREQTLSAGSTIGREGCDVNLMDPEVSRRHATIREEGGGSLAIEDLGSTNGTYVNGARISSVTVLSDGDTVRLGNTVWSIRAVVAPAGATTAGQVQSGGPQVTAARSVPSDIDVPSAPPAPPASAPPAAPAAPEPQPTTAQAVPAAPPAAPAPQPTTAQAIPAAAAAPPAARAAAAAPQQPAQPGAPSAAPVGRRGDVEAPPEVAPSAIRRVLPPPAPGAAPVFQPPGARPGGSAATRVEATVVCMIIVAAVAAVLAIYFITY
jgi:predicted component of type VI protein secretion system